MVKATPFIEIMFFDAGYNSKKVGSNSNGYGQMLIVQDPNQFLPVAVYNLINA